MKQAEKVVYRFLNVATRVLLYSPVHSILSGTTLILIVSGRKSGKCYHIPVSYITVDETLVCFTSSTWSSWWKNLRGGVPVTVRINGRTQQGIATATAGGSEETVQNLYVFLQHFPTTANRYQVNINKDKQPIFNDVVCATQNPNTIMISIRLAGCNNFTGVVSVAAD